MSAPPITKDAALALVAQIVLRALAREDADASAS